MHTADHITLAVFPFEDLSLQKDLNIFCRSFSADLKTELSKFRQFGVISYPNHALSSDTSFTSFFDELKTDYFIQGNFRCDKDVVRINVQLYNTHTQQLVWGNRLEGKLNNLDEIHENVLIGVVGILQQQINYDLLSRIRKRPKVEFKAYEHWLYGVEELKKGSVENDLKARQNFQKSIEIQPDYSLAYSGMSLTYFNEWSCQLWDRWNICKSGAYEWAQKAIELDDQNYIAAMVLGKIFLYDGSYETAEYYLRRSLMLNPNDPETQIQIAAYLVYLGLSEEAVNLYERTMQLHPIGNRANLIGSFIFFELGEYEKAASLIVQSKNAKWADAEAYYAATYYHLQQYDKMQTYWETFLDTYHKLINHGKNFTQHEAIEWLIKINPHKNKTNLESFLKFISNGSLEKYSLQNSRQLRQAVSESYFLKQKASWKISFDGRTIYLQEVKGFYDIHKLLSQPRQLIHCAELMGTTLVGKGERIFDSKARQEYEKKLLELQVEIEEAESHSNFLKLEKLQVEYDNLIEHLSQALGLKGKVRESGNPIEKARSAVTWRIRNAIARIESQYPLLGAHLSNAIKTGTFCCYQPDRNLSWVTS